MIFDLDLVTMGCRIEEVVEQVADGAGGGWLAGFIYIIGWNMQ